MITCSNRCSNNQALAGVVLDPRRPPEPSTAGSTVSEKDDPMHLLPATTHSYLFRATETLAEAIVATALACLDAATTAWLQQGGDDLDELRRLTYLALAAVRSG